jgi:hydroxysqualene dehydroxylase
MKVAVVGGGWAGMAAAVGATRKGHDVSLFEAARHVGGRARALPMRLPDGTTAVLDNGQHILVGAYRETLQLMRDVGVDPERVLLRLPLRLRFPDGGGLSLPAWPAPLDAIAGIMLAGGWSLQDRLALVRTSLRWRQQGFQCAPALAVRELCDALPPRVMGELVEPLCVSALNTPTERASAQVFLTVLRDTLFSPRGSNLLLPRADLGTLFPQRAGQWLQAQGGQLRLGHRVRDLSRRGDGWLVDGQPFDAVLLACASRDAVRLVEHCGVAAVSWLELAGALREEAIATVYATGGQRLPQPMLALRSGPQAPAQFVFDRSQLGGPAGLLAFVVSACNADQESLEREVMSQARALGWLKLAALRTVVERRATFACTPGLRRPPSHIAPGLLACGDYVEGPYPATLEGAVRSGLRAVADLAQPGADRFT